MSPERLQQWGAKRAALSRQREDLAALPADEERDQAMRQIDGLLRQIDDMMESEPVKATRPRGRAMALNFEQIAEVARLRQRDTAEIRITVQQYGDRIAVDIRQWALGRVDGKWRPTAKGVFVNAPLLQALIAALQQAQPHLQQS